MISFLDLIPTLEERGFIYQTTEKEALKEKLNQGPLTLYAGFDATAPSFHVGNLLILMMLRWFQRAGHHVIVLLGGGTTQVGDPSDKKSARAMMEIQSIQRNLSQLESIVRQFFSEGVQIVNNADWLQDLSYMTFLRETAGHFSVNRMMGFEFVKSRLDNNLPLSFLELNYMLLQAYDFRELFDLYHCHLQIGGADQWANILNGVELIRKTRSQETFAITCPLLTTATGAKMGKTVQGAVWLQKDLFSPYDFWQFWRNTDDQDVEKFLKLFTFLPLEKIKAITKVSGAALNDAKKILADQVTTLIHGEESLPTIHQTVSSFFGESLGPDIDDPTLSLQYDHLENGISVLDCLEQTGWVKSRGEARRLIRGGGVRLKDQVVLDENLNLIPQLWGEENHLKLSVGPKRHIWLTMKKDSA